MKNEVQVDQCLFVHLGLVHPCRQNRELVPIDKVLRFFIDKLQVWMRDKKFQIILDLLYKIGDLSVDNLRFCLQVCTKP